MDRIILLILFVLIPFSSSFLAQKETVQALDAAAQPVPVSYGIVADNSGSYRLLLEKVVRLTSDLVDENGAEDEAFLVTFVDAAKIVLRQDFTSKKADLRDAAENMFIEGGQTAILDAVKSAAQHLDASARSEPGRARVLVLITDGDEHKSVAGIEEVLQLLKATKIKVFVIGLAEGKVDTKLLARLSKETGGVLYLPKPGADISTISKGVAAAIRAP